MYLTLFLALGAAALSLVAAYYSIVGLAAIFAASVIPIVIMGAVIEYCKVMSVAWLHLHWETGPKKLVRGLSFFVIVSMIVTSVGVFGFLSKAHTGQTAASTESIAQVQRIVTEVERRESVIDRAEIKIDQLQNSGFVVDNSVQEQIDQEQTRIDSALSRAQPAIDEQMQIIAGQSKIYQSQIDTIDADLARLQGYIDNDEITKLQQLIGEKSKGGWGPLTAATVKKWREVKDVEKRQLINKLESIAQDNTAIIAARKEISRLRSTAEEQIAQSNALINRLRGKLGNTETADNTDELIDAQYARITESNLEIEKLTTEKYALEAETRQLEADVGPLKYIAELVYSDADRDLLEKAVRGIIVMILVVLDPFAIFLILAVTYSLGGRFKTMLKRKTTLGDDHTDPEMIHENAELEEQIRGMANQEMDMAAEIGELYSSNEKFKEDLGVSEHAREVLQYQLDEAITVADEKSTALADQESTLQTALDELEAIPDTMESIDELESTKIQRDLLQADLLESELKLNEMKLLKQRLEAASLELDVLSLAHDELVEKNLGLEQQLINTPRTADYPIDGLTGLQTKNKFLEARVASMVELADFDIESAQELVELKKNHHNLEIRMTNLVNENKILKGET